MPALDLALGLRMIGVTACVRHSLSGKVFGQISEDVGRPWGVVEEYKYSKSLITLGKGKIWDTETLDVYPTKPKELIPKGKMAFSGLKKEVDRANVIAYLAQLDQDGASE
ncbi:cytochrome c family protein [Roseibium sp. HPY-6]|uniref:c-type cytochrome n=1 Tax=Roseibium sp. HPY-6 TaxID=3229852 RepID=UPI00338FF447